MRRVVTGHTSSGKSVIVDDTELPLVTLITELMGVEVTEL